MRSIRTKALVAALAACFVVVTTSGCPASAHDAGSDAGSSDGGGSDAVATDMGGTDSAVPIDCGPDIELTWTVVDVQLDEPVPQVVVDLFTIGDPATALASGASNGAGIATLCVSAPVSEPYARMTLPGYKDTYEYLDDIDASAAGELAIISESTWSSGHSLLLILEDPTTGVIIGRVVDPSGYGVADVVVSVDLGGTVVYLDGVFPSGRTATTSGATFGVYGATPGARTLLGVGPAVGGMRAMEIFADSAHLIQLVVEPVACGNGLLEPGEGCDDGNVLPGDGCDDVCQTEP